MERLRKSLAHLIAITVCTASMLAMPACQTAASGEDEAVTNIGTSSCGVERWSIKTGTDSAAAGVNMTPQDTTIGALRAMPVPAGLSSGSSRFTNSAENQVWRLTNVTLTQYKGENDSDYHLILQDSGGTMIAEIPSPSCVSGGPWASAISAARSYFDAHFTVTNGFQTANVPATITGAGFFDLQHGQTGVAPNGIELHAVLSVCVGLNCAGGASPDFSLGASPASVSAAQGSSAGTTVSATASNGFSNSVALSASGLPSGASASFSPTSVAAGASSTLTLTAGSATPPGTYSITVTGTNAALSHTTAVSFTVTSGGGGGPGGNVVNGGFELGTLSGWSPIGAVAVVVGGHSGSFAARVGSTSPSTDSSISQTVTLPSGRPTLSLWYKIVCPDTIRYDWASVKVTNASGTVLATPLGNTCANGGTWVNATADLSAWAGTAVTLTFSNHDDNYSGDPTYTLFDDVSISGGSGSGDFSVSANPSSVTSSPGSSAMTTVSANMLNGFSNSVALSASGAPAGATASFNPTTIPAGMTSALTLAAGSSTPAGTYSIVITGTSGALTHTASVSWTVRGGSNLVVNGGFETGTLSGWAPIGSAAAVAGGHSGSFAAQVGSTSPSTDSSISQSVTLPAGHPTLSFWYKNVCPDTIQYDWASATVTDASGTALTTPLANTCTNSGAWVNVTADLSAWAGTTVTLVFSNHDDNYSGDPSYTLYDDVAISGGSGGSPDFSLGANPSSVSSAQGGLATSAISAAGSNGFSGTISLSAGGLPSGGSASFSSNNLNAGGSSTLTLSAASSTPAGAYSVTINGTSGTLSHSTSVSWTVTSSATPDFSLSSNPGAVSSAQGASASSSISAAGSGGFSGNVALSASGLPSGANASFSATSIGGGGSSTLTLSAASATPPGTYPVTITGTSGTLSHTTSVSWTVTAGGGSGIRTVFLILMENHNWSSIKGSSSAPYINNTLLAQGVHAENYFNPSGIHPSEPNYLWLEAGTNFGVLNDGLPSANHQSTTQHLVTLLQNAGITWKSYQEGISGSSCPLTNSGLYAPKHNPMVFFDDVTSSSSNCVAHVRPYTELATALSNNTVARYNFITPNLCNDMHGATGCPADSIATGDTWLSQAIPQIMNSQAYQNGGAIFVTWDESEGGDFPIGMIVLSPLAKAGGYSNNISYTHSSMLRTTQEIFRVTPLLGDAANATNLSDLFTSFP